MCEELGLYSGDLDRFGVLSFDAWRACRLVVDTGLHALGWTRQEAIDYMTENTLLATNNVVNEVDRYIAWPGQAWPTSSASWRSWPCAQRPARPSAAASTCPSSTTGCSKTAAVTLAVLRDYIEAWILTELEASAR